MRTLIVLLIVLAPIRAVAYTMSLEWDPTDQPTVTVTRLYTQAGPNAAFVAAKDVPQPETKVMLEGLQDELQYAFYATYLNRDGLESGPSNVVYWVTLPYLKLKPEGLVLSGTAGRTYAIDASGDLKTWIEVARLVAPSDRFTVPIDFSAPKMFFRVRRIQ